jgi:N-acetylmuramoyl-L-alanine amidase
MIVLIDNGHGKETKGKRSPDGKLLEYAWTREVARMLVARLVDNGIEAQLVTPEDEDVKLAMRVARINAICKARGASNVLVISLHNNAATTTGAWGSARGFIPFVSTNAGISSRRLARLLYDAAVAHGLKGNRWMPSQGYQTKSLAICRDTKCAAVLTENLFMDNREDCAYLLTAEGKDNIVQAHVEAIQRYIFS